MIKKLLPLLLLIFIGCNKNNSDKFSSNNNINLVIFKKSGNPGLPGDITGVFVSDSIIFDVPQNMPVNSMTPTISFNGKKIEPASNTAQDFTHGLNYKVTAEDGSIHNYLFLVNKISSDTSTLILGTWKIIKDSVTNNNFINPAGGNLIPGVYIGTAVDYWKFDANGVFSGRENNITGSDTYSITPNHQLNIPVWSMQYGPGTIETLTSNQFTVWFSANSSNGGHYFRKVYLKR